MNYSDKQTVNGEDIVTSETATHYQGILQVPGAAIASHIVELRHPTVGFRIQIDGVLWHQMRARDSRKSPKIGILYDMDSLSGDDRVIPMYLQAWSDGDGLTRRMAIFAPIHNGAMMDPRTFYTLTRGDIYTGV